MSMEERTPLLVDNEAVSTASKPVTPLPKLQLFCVYFIQFAEPVTATVVYPFIVQLVRDTGIAGGVEARNGYYAGFIESIFYASEALTTLQWGMVSDRIGRKPPLIFGMMGLAVAVTGFGLSTTFVPLVIFRALQGVFNGNIGITKAVMGEITNPSNTGSAFSMIPLMWGLGVILGPMIGGMLSHPAAMWPDTVGKIAFFQSYPYFLPCFVAAMVPIGACLFAVMFLKETLPFANAEGKVRSLEGSSIMAAVNEQTIGGETAKSEDEEPATIRSLMTPQILTVLANYAFTVFVESASGAIQPLIYATPISNGGLGLSSFQIGIILSMSGLMLGLSSFLFFPFLERKLGLTLLYRIGFAGHLVMQIAYALMNMLAQRNDCVDNYVLAAVAVQITLVNFTVMTFTCMFMQINNAAPNRRALGTLNGLAQTVATTCRIFAPITASSLFSLSKQHNLLGGTMVYCILAGIVVCGLLVSLGLPQTTEQSD